MHLCVLAQIPALLVRHICLKLLHDRLSVIVNMQQMFLRTFSLFMSCLSAKFPTRICSGSFFIIIKLKSKYRLHMSVCCFRIVLRIFFEAEHFLIY
jgi:hypothetical protein